ncbi:hypothetical protein LAV73_08685 [Lysinibacillus xylanilyticus]|uniref:hypothetical protein n=1 Tax=Lysinibacillus xylanilyticus TaxID=582475 RepID=UPI002B25566D|nr:hypothetical protein [Lysinibacillus xylanilyticus]MEB2280074.1 hypothetical protein [Lysinibacillus xylanilyticus]
MIGLTVVTGMVEAAIGSFIERKVIEDPLGKVCDNALNKFLNKNEEEKRYLNNDLEKGINRAFFKALKRVSIEVITITEIEATQEEWLINRLKVFNKEIDKKLDSIEKSLDSTLDLEIIFHDLSRMINPNGTISNKEDVERELIEIALSYDIPSEIYINKIKSNIYTYTKSEFIVEIKFTEEIYKMFTAQLLSDTNEKVNQLVKDSVNQNEILNEIKDQQKRIFEEVEFRSDNNALMSVQNVEGKAEELIIRIKNEKELITSDTELFLLVDKANDILREGKLPVYLIEFEMIPFLSEKIGELKDKLTKTVNENEILSIKRDFRDFKSILERKERQARNISNMLKVLYDKDSLYSYVNDMRGDFLINCIKKIIEIGLDGNTDNYNGIKIEAYASQDLPSFKFRLSEEEGGKLFKNENDYMLLRVPFYYFLTDLPINEIIEKAIPSYLQTYTILIDRFPELESDSKFNNLFTWYIGLA